MSAKEFLDGVFTGVIITGVFVVAIIFIIPFPKTYMIASDGMKVESVAAFTSRGACLEQLETNMKDGPNQLVWQCIDRKD